MPLEIKKCAEGACGNSIFVEVKFITYHIGFLLIFSSYFRTRD